jgi:hypothetical protein
MQYVAKQDRINGTIVERKVSTVKLPVIDCCFGMRLKINADYTLSQHRREVMCYETTTAADIEHARLGGKHSSDLEGHIICAPDFASPSLAAQTALNSEPPKIALGTM